MAKSEEDWQKQIANMGFLSFWKLISLNLLEL